MHRARIIEYILVFLFLLGIGATLVALYTPGQTERVRVPDLVHIKKQPLTFLVVGDIMLGRNVGNLMRTNGNDFPFARIGDLLASVDFVFGNLEGPITELDNEPENNLRFHFDPSVAEALNTYNVRLVSLANNHWGDQGLEGHNDTKQFLNDAHVAYVGGKTESPLGTVATVPGTDVVFIGLDTTITPVDFEELHTELLAFPSDTALVALVHWGDEYEPAHNEFQETFAHFLIDNGVDIVFGAHPHVIEDRETYKGKEIFYSLGNFIFDQYWNDEVQTGLVVKVTVGDELTIEPVTIKSEHSQPFVLVDESTYSGTMNGAKP